jgi:hypothetical protein
MSEQVKNGEYVKYKLLCVKASWRTGFLKNDIKLSSNVSDHLEEGWSLYKGPIIKFKDESLYTKCQAVVMKRQTDKQ